MEDVLKYYRDGMILAIILIVILGLIILFKRKKIIDFIEVQFHKGFGKIGFYLVLITFLYGLLNIVNDLYITYYSQYNYEKSNFLIFLNTFVFKGILPFFVNIIYFFQPIIIILALLVLNKYLKLKEGNE